MSDSSEGPKRKASMKLNTVLPLQANTASSQRAARRAIHPLGYRVVVRILKDNNQTEAGLYLPEGAKENMQESILVQVTEVATATDEDTDHETNVSGVPLGALVLIPKSAGIKVPWDDNLRIIDTEDVLCVVTEESVI
jgi:co-chaperonin GroES (HSP10)